MGFWDFRSNFYDATRKIFPFNLIFKIELQNTKLLLDKIDIKNAAVLDVASGTGAILPLLPANWKTVRTDSSIFMLKKTPSNPKTIAADCNHLPFKPASFDVITAVGLIEYLKNPKVLFKHLQNITTDGAKIIFTYAQFNFFNIARNLIGHRIYIHNPKNLEQFYFETGFQKEAQLTSLMQTQVLLKKYEAEI